MSKYKNDVSRTREIDTEKSKDNLDVSKNQSSNDQLKLLDLIEPKQNTSIVNKKDLDIHRKETGSKIDAAIKSISYLSFVISIGLTIIVSVVLNTKNPGWSEWRSATIIISILVGVTISFAIILSLIYHLFFSKNKFEIKIHKLKTKKEYKEYKLQYKLQYKEFKNQNKFEKSKYKINK